MAPFEEHDFTYGDGKTTHYLASGQEEGPLLIFIHGWPGIAKLWKPQLTTFAALGFRVVAPDMPGTYFIGLTGRCDQEPHLLT
jgi:soluble epoxide hydrolase/lipid-phosphate phosphatase